MPVANQYTLNDVLSLNNHSVVAFYNSVLVGVLQKGEHKVAFTPDTEMVDSSLLGSTPIAVIQKGGELKVTLALQGENKNRMKNIYSRQYTTLAGGTATADTTPDVGAIALKANPQMLPSFPLVLYPILTDSAGTSYIDDVSNKNAWTFGIAIATNGFEFSYTTEDILKYEIEFSIMGDVTNDGLLGIHDDGIASTGVHTV